MYANSYNFEQQMQGALSERHAAARQSRRALLARLAERRATARPGRSFTRLLAFSGR